MSAVDSEDTKSVSSTKDDNIKSYDGLDASAHDNIKNLARTISQISAGSLEHNHSLSRISTSMSKVPGEAPFLNDLDPRLDPNSDQFNSRYWVKNLKKLMQADPEYYKQTSLGIAYRDLRASGIAADADFQVDVTNMALKYSKIALRALKKYDPNDYFDILKPMDAIMRPGELTVVLGRPGSGCSTLLKTISAHTHGFKIAPESKITYDGLSPIEIERHFRGDVIYSAESDIHFPHLSVGDTLKFAAKLRTPQNRTPGITRDDYAQHMTDAYMATYGLSHTRNTKVGNDFVRGVSGGERKRVSIAEASLSGATIQCWDNATRGLDSATALEFIKALKTSAEILESTPLIAIYQCSQDAYDLFDNVVLLYEGYQIFYGKADKAKDYFINMGYECPQRQTTADFLTSLTNPVERVYRPGFEGRTPNTPKEFEEYWKNSPEYKALVKEIDDHFAQAANSASKTEFLASHVAKQAKHIRPQSSYTVSFPMQVKYLMSRDVLRTKGDPSVSLFTVFGQLAMGLILSSMFYNLKSDTASFYYRGAAIFYAVLFNAFSSLLEIMALFEARPIVEKHKKFALYHPAAESVASVITSFPVKLASSMSFNYVFYFMVNLRRNPGRFFFYWLMGFTCTVAMSFIFRTIGSMTTSVSEAMTPASVMLLAMTIFAGFVIPTNKMLGWSRWINYLNPVGYTFEALMANEFHDRNFTCSAFVPSYASATGTDRVCSVVGSIAGNDFVRGDDYVNTSFQYYAKNKWRDWAIVFSFCIFFFFLYVTLTEYNKGAMQKGEVLIFQRAALKKMKKHKAVSDIEGATNEKVPIEQETDRTDSGDENKLPGSTETFHWRGLTYQVRIKTEDRVILNDVSGWVKPGQLTALMGSSGAGKTTLLNALSDRLTSGVITGGTRMVNGHKLDASFQRSIGYAQQQDLHLNTSTVREALRFSAYLRQPASISIREKNEYAEYIIDLLEMSKYADAVVGVAGEGLNVEQRKRLTIGVELVAKPKLLLFLDEPTSGLDSQTAWSICKLMRKLADHGQAILCTIHQPSAILLQEFDRLLFLQKGGRTVYFGDLGENCATLINYFEKYGAPKCPTEANPAEWMLEVIGAAPGSHALQDYYEVWKNSTEAQEVQKELDYMETELVKIPHEVTKESQQTFAANIFTQYLCVVNRVFQQYWRTPSYILSKLFLAVSSSLFNGFSFFKADHSMQGLQNQMFSVFMFTVVFNTLIQQMLPHFVAQRDLYEVRERPSKTFSWVAFIFAQITAELPFNVVMGTLSFLCWYYPVGLYQNAVPTHHVNQRGILMWLFITCFFHYTSTMGQACMSFMELADNAANLATLLFTMCLSFCGVLVQGSRLGWWIFMYRCSPFTYFIQGVLSTGLSDTYVKCSNDELVKFTPANGETCGTYMQAYMNTAGGYLVDSNATSNCEFCAYSDSNVFLDSIGAVPSQKWRNWGIFVAFIFINAAITLVGYWAARVPKGKSKTSSS